MNRLSLSVLAWHLSFTDLYFAGRSSSNAQLIKKVYGVIKEDLIITCKFEDSIQRPTFEPKVITNFPKRMVAELQFVKWLHYKHPEDHKNAHVIVNTHDFIKQCHFSSRYESLIISLHTAQLRIKELLVSDAGFYFCDPVNKIKAEVKGEPEVTQVIIKAVPISKTFFQMSPLEANKPMMLQLNMIRFYPRDIQVDWLMDKSQLEGSTLLSVNAQCDGTFNAMAAIAFVPQAKDDSKTITCQITHESKKIPKVLKLQVAYGPVSLRVQPGKNVLKRKGDLLELLCISNSNPIARMSWSFNGTVLQSKQTNQLKIKVENISLSDQGNYTCSAENTLGTRTSVVVVNVTDSMTSDVAEKQVWLVSGISTSVVLLLIIVTSVVVYALIRKHRATGQQVENPLYMVSSHPNADVYETLEKADTEEPSIQKMSEAIYANTLQNLKGFNSAPAKTEIAIED
ncbi:cell adhesion molecule 3-like isoform X2 [Carcharodon carcharias]|uniref:cell adhesion molecule 3-like isoform X2 n=1 Tax=Carcharodon carcharias TaxID=13397 RepID=UPI001B7EDD11|nr:cell adhesion molecule 3-like isoform X2 [Carcharodon carcharias]